MPVLIRIKAQMHAWRAEHPYIDGELEQGREPWEEPYFQALEALVLEYPEIIAAVDDLRDAVGRIRARYSDLYWAAVRRDLAAAGITLGERAVNTRLMTLYHPVTIETRRPDGRRRCSALKAKIWCNPYGDEMCISTLLPKSECEAIAWFLKAKGLSAKEGLAIALLPGDFSNESLSRLVADPDELQRMAAETAAAIRKFIADMQALPRKEKG